MNWENFKHYVLLIPQQGMELMHVGLSICCFSNCGYGLWCFFIQEFWTRYILCSIWFFFPCVFVLHTIVSEYLGGSFVMAKRQMCMLLLLDENDK